VKVVLDDEFSVSHASSALSVDCVLTSCVAVWFEPGTRELGSFLMGRAGIRRRKPAHQLPKSHEHYDDAELGRAFGNFRWSAYTPAGSIERLGFMTRQVSRRRRHPEWNTYNNKTRLIGEALLIIPYAVLAIVGVVYVAGRLFGA
jgi:hypothetical protein